MIDTTAAILDTLGSVIAPVDTLQKSVNNWGGLWSFLGAIEWAAVGAIVTALIAIYAFNANRKSRRAYLLPVDSPGYFRSPELGGSRIGLTITLENFGSNPAYKILGQIFLLDAKTCIISLPVGVVNPIAPGGKWIIGLGLPVLELLSKGDRGIWRAIYIVMKIQYFDKSLKKNFPENLYWAVVVGGALVEPSGKDMEIINSITLPSGKVGEFDFYLSTASTATK